MSFNCCFLPNKKTGVKLLAGANDPLVSSCLLFIVAKQKPKCPQGPKTPPGPIMSFPPTQLSFLNRGVCLKGPD